MEAHNWHERRHLRLSSLGRSRRRRPTSTRDAETGLLHQAAFFVVGAHALRHSGRLGEPSGLVCIGLEHASRPGEKVGPEQLRMAVKLLLTETRAEDVLARTGILELCALLPGAGEDEAASVAQRLEDVFGLAAAVSAAVAPQLDAVTWRGPDDAVVAAQTRPAAEALRASLGWAVARPGREHLGTNVQDLLRIARSRAV